jgi:hypothetical protein
MILLMNQLNKPSEVQFQAYMSQNDIQTMNFGQHIIIPMQHSFMSNASHHNCMKLSIRTQRYHISILDGGAGTIIDSKCHRH